MSILVVDDDVMIRAVLAQSLAWAGHTVLEAADGQTALELLRRPESGITLILLDLMLPVMTGWELVALLALDPHLSGLPVVVLSAVSQVTERIQARNIVAVFSKPVELTLILELAIHYDGINVGQPR